MARSVVLAALLAASIVAACGDDSPTTPSEPVTSSITSVRYERVKPLVGDSDAQVSITIWYALAPGDPYDRVSPRVCLLERTGPTSFACSRTFDSIPVGSDWSVQVTDPAVSSLPVARDVFLNGTALRVETYANGAEAGRFRLDRYGRVS